MDSSTFGLTSRAIIVFWLIVVVMGGIVGSSWVSATMTESWGLHLLTAGID